VALTDLKIRRSKPAEKAYKVADSGGLYIEVRPTGSKLWRYRYRIAGKENVFAIGEYPDLSLADARAKRDEAKALVKQGFHPSHVRQAEKLENIADGGNTFKVIAQEYIEQKSRTWSEDYAGQFERAMKLNVYPRIGRLPIRQVTAAHILEIMRTIEKRGAPTFANRVRGWISQVFRFAASTMRVDADPAAVLAGAITVPEPEHATPLEPVRIGEFLKRLKNYTGRRTTCIALELLLLTFVRTAEARRAEWRDIDWDDRIWKIPASKMKKRRVHWVPLSDQVLKLLEELHGITGSGQYLFPNTHRQGIMGARTVNRALENMGYPPGDVTGHDFRATASTLLYERGYHGAHIELQLAHVKKDKTEAAYNHAQFLPERRQLMQDWADYVASLESGESNVVGIRSAGQK